MLFSLKISHATTQEKLCCRTKWYIFVPTRLHLLGIYLKNGCIYALSQRSCIPLSIESFKPKTESSHYRPNPGEPTLLTVEYSRSLLFWYWLKKFHIPIDNCIINWLPFQSVVLRTLSIFAAALKSAMRLTALLNLWSPYRFLSVGRGVNTNSSHESGVTVSFITNMQVRSSLKAA